MDGALGQFGNANSGSLASTPNPLVSPASMTPAAMSNMVGTPLANEGANMAPYLQMQEAFTPKPLQGQGTPSASYAKGGLIGFAEGGMPPPQGGMPDPQGMSAQAEQGAPQEGMDPRIMQMVQQIFEENIQNPKAIADALLKLVMTEIRQSVTPEQMEQIQSPEGQAMLKQELEKMMQQMQGGLGQMQGAGAPQQGAPDQGAMMG